MRRLTLVAGCVAAVVLAMGASEILAASITVNASTDVWVRETDPGAAFEDDGVSV